MTRAAGPLYHPPSMATEVKLYELIKEVLPNDHARQISALDYIEPITKVGARMPPNKGRWSMSRIAAQQPA